MTIKLPYVINNEQELEAALKLSKGMSWAKKVARRSYLRSMVSEAQNHRCCYCYRTMNLIPNHKMSCTLEHVVPQSKGGTDDLSNLVAACSRCNGKRGDKVFDATNENCEIFKNIQEFLIKGMTHLEVRQKTQAQQHHDKINTYIRRMQKLVARGNFSFEQWVSSIKMTPEGVKSLEMEYARTAT